MEHDIPMVVEGYTYNNNNFAEALFVGHEFSNCVFEKCDFTSASFERASFWNCTFIECNLSVVNLKECRINEVLFKGSKLFGLNFALCDTALLFSFNAHSSFITGCNFSSLPMSSVSFKNSKVIECKFIDTSLKGACFSGTDLAGTLFIGCDLRGANFVDAVNYCINPCTNKVEKARFTFPECIGLVKALDVVLVD